MGNQHQRKEISELISWFAQSEELILSVYFKYALRQSLKTVIDEHSAHALTSSLFPLHSVIFLLIFLLESEEKVI